MHNGRRCGDFGIGFVEVDFAVLFIKLYGVYKAKGELTFLNQSSLDLTEIVMCMCVCMYMCMCVCKCTGGVLRPETEAEGMCLCVVQMFTLSLPSPN